MKNLYALCFAISFSFLGIAQITTNYSAKWFLGLNTGATWNTGDVRTKVNNGFGLHLGKSFNYNYGRIVSFDLRSRFLYGFWYGQDYTASDFSQPNLALSQEPANYKDSLGFSVNNFQTEVYRWSLELALHANRFRERTRIDPYIFGGIGLTWHQTYGDLLYYDTIVGNKNLYQYDKSNLSKSSIKKTKDGVYETALDGSLQNRFNLNVMPSLGVGLGYQLSRNVTIGFEHKTTFTGLDNFDGVVKSSKYLQDLYHYDNIYLQVRFGRDRYVNENENFPPQVNFTNPDKSFSEVRDSVWLLQAEIKHVFDRENVTLLHDNAVLQNFSFNEKTDRFAVQVDLKRGSNKFILIGTNQYGQDSDTLVLVLKDADAPVYTDSKKPPIVSFQQPQTSPLTIENPNYSIEASVVHVLGKQNIQLYVNSIEKTDFQYNTTNKLLTSSIRLNEGTNEVRIKATNEAGVDEEKVLIVYKKQNSLPAPTVQFTDPASSPFAVTNNAFQVKAQLQNVSNKAGIQFKQNGQQQNSFVYDASKGQFSANVILVAGNNLFEIVANNQSGNAADQTIIQYNRSAPKPPIVSVSQPAQSTFTTSSSKTQLVGRVLNVITKNQVELILNGRAISTFDFTSGNGNVTAQLDLMEGNNYVKLSGSNNDGIDSKELTIVYKPTNTENPPVVRFVNPNTTSSTVTDLNYDVQASVANVSNSNKVQVKVNGTVFSGFRFTNGLVNFNLTLVEGANVIEVRGTNSAGSDSKSVTLFYKKPQTVYPPVVTFEQPSTSPTTVQLANASVQSKVTNVVSKSDIVVKLNGKLSQGFTYSASSKLVSFDVILVEGTNSVEVIGTNSAGSDSKTTLIVYRPRVAKPPVVTIIDPSSNPYEVKVSSYKVVADISNIENANQLTATLNGQNLNVTYNTSSGRLECNVNLVEGENTIAIKAKNVDGEAEDRTIIIYRKPIVRNIPIVAFVKPSEPGTKVSSNNYLIEAKIFNIDSKDQIEFKQNGQVVGSAKFSYDVQTNILRFDAILEPGNNVFEIEARNETGKANAQTSLVYQKPIDPCNVPIIEVLHPLEISTKVEDSLLIVRFKVKNEDSSSKTLVKLNGTTQQGLVKTENGFEIKLSLFKGSNVIELAASNTCGESSISLFVTYKPKEAPCLKPVFTLISPSSSGGAFEMEAFDIEIGVSNVSNSVDILLRMNDQNLQFEWDAAAKILKARVNLNIGLNSIILTATNICGKTEQILDITRLICEKPIITLNVASIPNGARTADRQLSLELGLGHVQMETQISVRLNNQTIPFEFDANNQILSIERTLNLGVAKLVIITKNNCGTVQYEHQVVILKSDLGAPTVVFTNPATIGISVKSQDYPVVFLTTNILNNSEVVLKLNGTNVQTTFDFTNQKGSANVRLSEGINNLEVIVANSAGSVSATSIIICELDSEPQKSPIIKMDGTVSKIETVALGLKKVSGRVENVSDPAGFVVKLNGKALTNVKTTVVDGSLAFEFTLNASVPNSTMVVEIIGSNATGRAQQYLTYKVLPKIDTPLRNPTPVIKPSGGR